MNALTATLQGFDQGMAFSRDQKRRKKEAAFQSQLEALLGGGSPSGSPVGTPGIMPNAPQGQGAGNTAALQGGPDYGAVSALYARNGDANSAAKYQQMAALQGEQAQLGQAQQSEQATQEQEVLYRIGKGVLDGKYSLDQAKQFLVQNGADANELAQVTEQSLPSMISMLEAKLGGQQVLKSNDAVWDPLTQQIIGANRPNQVLSDGAQLVDAQGGVLADNPKDVTPKLPTGMRMGENGPEYIPGYLDGQERLKRAGKAETNITLPGQDRLGGILSPEEVAKVGLPEGTVAQIDAKGGVKVIQDSKLGSKVKATAAMESFDRATNTTTDAIEKAITQVSGVTAGLGSLSSALPGTPAADLAATISTIKANVAFNRLEEMRANSPTGGALGQVTERELDLLASVQGAIEQAQSPDQLRANLMKIKTGLEAAKAERQKAYNSEYGSSDKSEAEEPKRMRFVPGQGLVPAN